LTVRQRKLDLLGRINGDLPLEFGEVALTSYAGLELFARYLRLTRFNTLVREAFAGTTTRGDYGIVAMVRLLLGLLIVGGRRLRHVMYVQGDPVAAHPSPVLARLKDGRALVIGEGTVAEVYFPDADSWSFVASPTLPRGERVSTATTLLDGTVPVAGARFGSPAADVYDPNLLPV
jgi:hypothetical protein